MKSNRQKTKDRVAESAKKLRLIATLTGAFDRATLLTLGIDDKGAKPVTKENRMRALIVRAKNRGCSKYVIARQYAANGELAAFRIFTDMDMATAEEVCRRWDLGPYEVSSVDTQKIDLYEIGLFSANSIPKHRFLFSPSEGIWDTPETRPSL